MQGKASKPLGEAAGRAFEEHYGEWSDPVYRYLIHLVGSPSAAEDLFQETWMKAFERRGQLRNADHFGPWVLRIARNVAFNSLRQRKKKVQVWILSNLASVGGRDPQADPPEDLIDRQASATPSPRDEAVSAQRREIIQEAIAELDLPTQEMLQLRYFEGLTLAQVASVLEVPLGTVCTKVHRGLKAIRQRLNKKGYSSTEEI